MASRLARSALGATRLRPTLPSRTLPAVASSLTSTRFQSNVPTEEPKAKAQSLIDALPGGSVVSKTGILAAFAGVSVAAISNEIYVVNEESIVMLSLLITYGMVAYYGAPLYKQWAEGQNNKIKNILNAAREDHTKAVEQRIENVKSLGGVVDITKNLFAVSKETAEIEAQVYELQQKTNLAAEAKAVLDSWVRYEGQLKARQQKELAESIISKIDKELEDPKVLKRILDQSVTDVERIIQQHGGKQGDQQQQQQK